MYAGGERVTMEICQRYQGNATLPGILFLSVVSPIEMEQCVMLFN